MTETEQRQRFLSELSTITGGQTGSQASMYEVGAAIGLDRNAAAMIAEDLIVDGLAELVSLSGSISITSEGLKQLGADQGAAGDEGDTFTLAEEPYLDGESCRSISACISRYRAAVGSASLGFEVLEEIVLDVKTLEVQLLSSRPKTPIVREVLKALADNALSGGLDGLHDEICSMLGK